MWEIIMKYRKRYVQQLLGHPIDTVHSFNSTERVGCDSRSKESCEY